jgi:hypothetical protein
MKRLFALGTLTLALGGFAAFATVGLAAEAPRNTALPAVSGTAALGQTLTAQAGTWSADPAPAFTYRWWRCNRNGVGCNAISGATAQTYVVRPADVGRRLRVAVTARNTQGTATARSEATPIVTTLPAGATSLPGGQTSVPVTSVALPQRLIIDRVDFSPTIVRSRTQPITIRVHVVDTRGYVVRGALVYVRATPLVTQAPPETATGDDGWVTLQTQPRADFPLRRGWAVQFFARARKSGESLLAGVSTRRLVQVKTAPAA